jgi:hypothetical protein
MEVLEKLLQESYYVPQPFPDFDNDLYPTILDIPAEEYNHYHKNVVNRYISQVFWYCPIAYSYALLYHKASKVSDDEFVRMFQQSCFGKFLTPIFTEEDKINFATQCDWRKGNYLKADFRQMGTIIPKEGFYTAGTVVIFQKEENILSLLAIQLDNQVLTAKDGDRFELAKHFAIMACCYYTVAFEHPKVHFPLDTINGITKLQLPSNHLLFKLLIPHFEYSLCINYAVLHSRHSIIKNNPKHIYAALEIDKPEFLKLMSDGYKGLEQNPNYKPYRFSLTPRTLHTDYGIFLNAYYQCILNFVRAVLPFIPIDDAVLAWADSIATYLEGFPDANEIQNPDIFAKTIAKIIWQSSVEHACDHYSFSKIPVHQLTYRMRISPNQPASFKLDRTKLRNKIDVFRHKMAWVLFFRPTNITLLKDTDYQFEQSELQAINRIFLKELRRTERQLSINNIFCYAPLSGISRSIQY